MGGTYEYSRAMKSHFRKFALMQGVPDTMKFLYEEDFRDEIYKKMKKSHYIVPVHHDFMVKLNLA